MKRKFICAVLAGALVLGTMGAWAAGSESTAPDGFMFPVALPDDIAIPEPEPTPEPIVLPFTDVAEKDWFFSNVAVCYEEEIMMGDSATTFSPYGILREEETATLAARLLARQRGETVPTPQAGESWYDPVLRYLADLHLNITPGVQCTRGRFLTMLGAVLGEDILEPKYEVNSLPDTSDPNILKFYRAGILNGKDSYGTFQASGTLPRAEAAAMVSRILRPELRITTALADYTPFRVLGVSPSTVFFSNGVTAEQFLDKVNELIALLEGLCREEGIEFNWYNTYPEGGQTFLKYVTETALSELGVTQSMSAQSQYYGLFDVQVYYAQLITLRGGAPFGD